LARSDSFGPLTVGFLAGEQEPLVTGTEASTSIIKAAARDVLRGSRSDLTRLSLEEVLADPQSPVGTLFAAFGAQRRCAENALFQAITQLQRNIESNVQDEERLLQDCRLCGFLSEAVIQRAAQSRDFGEAARVARASMVTSVFPAFISFLAQVTSEEDEESATSELSSSSSSSLSARRAMPLRAAAVLSSADAPQWARHRSKASTLLGIGSGELREEREQRRHRVQQQLESGLTPASLPLRGILESPVQLEPFLMFAEANLSADPVLFWLRVEEYKRCPSGGSVRASLASNIWKNFLAPEGERQISLSAPALRQVRARLAAAEATLFDVLQREAYQIVALSVYPEYLAFLRRSPAQLAAPEAAVPQDDALAPIDDESESELSFSGAPHREDAKQARLGCKLLVRVNSLPNNVRGLEMESPSAVRRSLVGGGSSEAVERLVRECGGRVDTEDFDALLASEPQRRAFVAFCEYVHAPELALLHSRICEYLAAESDPLQAGQIATSILHTYLAEDAPQHIALRDSALLRHLHDAIVGQSEDLKTLLIQLQSQAANLLRLQLFPAYCRFAQAKGFASAARRASALRRQASLHGMPSLRECLLHDFNAFLTFAERAQCGETLLFWNAVTAFERVAFGDYRALHKAADEIYAEFLSPLAPQEVNVDPRIGAKAVLYCLRHELVQRDIFAAAKKEVEMVMLQDLWPRYVFSEQQRGEQLAVAARAAPRPDVSIVLEAIAKDKAALQLQQPQPQQRWGKLRADKEKLTFDGHPFWTEPKRRLRVVQCAARTSREVQRNQLGELRLIHCLALGDFRILLRNAADETVLRSGPVTQDECRVVLRAFCDLGDYVVLFRPIRRKRSVTVEDPVLGGVETVHVESSFSSDADVGTSELDDSEDARFSVVRGYMSN
jgi:hypothetical protein